MQIIKEFCPKYNSFILRTQTYAHTLSHFEYLFAVARNDFPGLSKNDVEIIHYGGKTYKRTFGIEFVIYDIDVPNDYQEISDLEETL